MSRCKHRVAYDVVSSTAVVDELMRQDHPKQTEKLSLLAPLRLLEPSPEVLEIVEVCVARKVMPADPLGDALLGLPMPWLVTPLELLENPEGHES
jgi:hypothetical protein